MLQSKALAYLLIKKQVMEQTFSSLIERRLRYYDINLSSNPDTARPAYCSLFITTYFMRTLRLRIKNVWRTRPEFPWTLQEKNKRKLMINKIRQILLQSFTYTWYVWCTFTSELLLHHKVPSSQWRFLLIGALHFIFINLALRAGCF